MLVSLKKVKNVVENTKFFVNKKMSDDFACLVCLAPATDNLQCTQCGKLCCNPCLVDWLARDASCPAVRVALPRAGQKLTLPTLGCS